MNLSKVRKQVNNIKSRRSDLIKLRKNKRLELAKDEKYLSNVEEAQTHIQNIAQSLQQFAHNKIAGVVARCLQSVFSPDYDFKIDFKKERGKTTAKLLLMYQGHEIENPKDNDSGGVLDVAAFALRVVCIVWSKPRVRRLLVLDEPFKFVSEEYRENVRMLLEKLSDEFDFQFIMVTHIKELEIGKVIRL